MDDFEPLAFLERAINKRRKALLVTGVVLCLLGSAPLGYTLIHGAGDGTTSDLAAGLGLAGFFFLVGVALLFAGARTSPGRDRIFTTLRDRPSDIVWIYEKDISRNGVVSHAVMICTRSGAEDGVDVPSPAAQIALRNALKARCPSAATGYSTERAQAFAQNPAALA